MAPLEVEEVEESTTSEDRRSGRSLPTSYEFEPRAEALLDALLPKYINTRIYAALLEAAASESASRRRAMKAATDNAEELIKNLTRRGQPGPPGRDHPGDQRDRRRRRTRSRAAGSEE